MKKIISFLLIVSVLSVSLFGCYAQASGASDPGNGKITEKQRKLYDKFFGAGNWYVDDNGVVRNRDEGTGFVGDQYKVLNNFLYQCVFPSKIMGQFSEITKYIQAFYQNNKDGNTEINNWFNKYDNSIDVGDDGNVSVGADAMQGFRSALSDQVYSLGCYKILSPNITIPDLKKKMTEFCDDKYPSSMDYYLNNYPNIFSGYYIKDNKKRMTFIYFPDSYIDSYAFLLNDDFDNTSKGIYKLGKYSSSSGKSSAFDFYGDSQIDSTGYRNYFILPGDPVYLYLSYVGSDFMYTGPVLKVFPSLESADFYYNSLLKQDYNPDVYIYNNYSPSNTTINLNNVNNYDYEKIINNAYNTINNEKNTTIKVNGSISDNDLQLIIKNAIDLAINETGGGNGGGSGGGSGGDDGGSGGSSGTDYTGILNSILAYCKSISDVVVSSDSRLELLVNVANQNKTLITGISASITDLGTSLGDIGVSVGNIEQYLKDISDQLKDLLGDDGSGGGGSLFDRLIDFLFRTLSNLLADLLGDVIKTIIGDLDKVTGPAKGLADAAQTKFPTSIPWDIIAIIGVMSAEPECPKFEIPFSVPRLGINETIKIDLSKADKVAELSRKMLTVTFLLFLVVQTRKLYGSMNNKN